MDRTKSDLWLVRRSPDSVVAAFFAAEGSVSRLKPELAEAAEAAARSSGIEAPADDGVSPCVIALTCQLSGVDEDTWGVLITQAARMFRSAEACLTERLGPGQAVEMDVVDWVPSGLPDPVIATASCTTSLVVAWPMEVGGWCVLEVDQGAAELPIAVVLYRVEAL